MTSDAVVIIPTYNEKENIELIIRAVFDLPKAFNILIVDDGSPDGTADIVRRLQTEFKDSLFIVERRDSGGPWSMATTTLLRWTPIFPTIPKT